MLNGEKLTSHAIVPFTGSNDAALESSVPTAIVHIGIINPSTVREPSISMEANLSPHDEVNVIFKI